MSLKIPLEKSNVISYNCPICNESDFYSYNQENAHNISLDVCKKCGFIFRSKFLDERSSLENLRYYHKSIPNISYYQKQKQKEYIIEKNFMSYDILKNKRVLEVGCGVGTFLSGLNDRCVGLEPAISHSMFAIEEYGVDARPTLYTKDRGFDVIIIHEYLHFIPNIREYVSSLVEKLNDDGVIYFYNPLVDSPSINQVRVCAQEIPLQYVNLFTKITFENLVRSCGLDIVKTDSDISDYMIIAKKTSKEQKINFNPYNSKKALDNFIKILQLSKEGKHEEVLSINNRILTSYLHLVKKDGLIVTDIDAAFDAIYKNMPNYAPAIGTVASALHQKGKLDEALRLFSEFEKKIMDPSTARVIALCHHDKGEFGRAVDYIRLEEELAGPNPETFNIKASLYWQKRSLKEFF